jgi:hypothetical protein
MAPPRDSPANHVIGTSKPSLLQIGKQPLGVVATLVPSLPQLLLEGVGPAVIPPFRSLAKATGAKELPDRTAMDSQASANLSAGQALGAQLQDLLVPF